MTPSHSKAVVYDAGSITVSTGTGAAVESKDRRARGWEEGGLVLVGSIHNFSNHSKNASYDKWAVCYHSSDHGRTLARGVDVHPDEASNISVNEPQLAKFANGTLLLVGQSGTQDAHDAHDAMRLLARILHPRSFLRARAASAHHLNVRGMDTRPQAAPLFAHALLN